MTASSDGASAATASNTVHEFERLKPSDIEMGEHDARRTIASRLVWAYLILVILGAAVPILLYFVGPSDVPTERLDAIRDISSRAVAGVSGLTGLLGFVLGYYFKTEESSKKS